MLQACSHQQQGAAIGGVAGGLAGYLLSDDQKKNTRIVATIAGAAVGAAIGGVIGDYMDRSDQEKVKKALKEVPTNKSRSWTNPKTGNTFTIKPISDVAKDGSGREYRKATLFAKQKGSNKLDATTKNLYL